MFRIILGGLIGGIISFIWFCVSWNILTWHHLDSQIVNINNNSKRVVNENMLVDGIFIGPHLKNSTENSDGKEEIKESEVGPHLYYTIKLENTDLTRPVLYFYSLCIQCIGAFFISWLLFTVVKTHYIGRLFFVTVMGLITGVLGVLPGFIWMGMGYQFIFITIADYLVQWFSAGIVLAIFVKKPKKREHELMM